MGALVYPLGDVIVIYFNLISSPQAWFADVWNYSIVPYASEAVREGIALYGRRRHAAVDPLQHIKSSYPWREPNHSHVSTKNYYISECVANKMNFGTYIFGGCLCPAVDIFALI